MRRLRDFADCIIMRLEYGMMGSGDWRPRRVARCVAARSGLLMMPGASFRWPYRQPAAGGAIIYGGCWLDAVGTTCHCGNEYDGYFRKCARKW